jgi:hypothetical protein
MQHRSDWSNARSSRASWSPAAIDWTIGDAEARQIAGPETPPVAQEDGDDAVSTIAPEE